MTDRRRTLLFALAALALVQLAHLLDVLRYADEAEFPSVLLDPLALVGIGAATVAFVSVLRRWRTAREIAIAAGGGVAVGFTLYHGIPFDIGVNNPYWGGDADSDPIRWLTVLAAIAVGAWAVWLARDTTDRPHVSERSRTPSPS